MQAAGSCRQLFCAIYSRMSDQRVRGLLCLDRDLEMKPRPLSVVSILSPKFWLAGRGSAGALCTC